MMTATPVLPARRFGFLGEATTAGMDRPFTFTGHHPGQLHAPGAGPGHAP